MYRLTLPHIKHGSNDLWSLRLRSSVKPTNSEGHCAQRTVKIRDVDQKNINSAPRRSTNDGSVRKFTTVLGTVLKDDNGNIVHDFTDNVFVNVSAPDGYVVGHVKSMTTFFA